MKRVAKDFCRRSAITALAVAALAAAAVYAAYEAGRHRTVGLGFSPGGSIGEFIERYDGMRRSGVDVRLDGMCISACTLVVGLIPAEKLCATPYATLAFHSAYVQTMMGKAFSKEGTRLLWHSYPEKLREFLRTQRNWDGDGETAEHTDLIYLQGDELNEFVRPC